MWHDVVVIYHLVDDVNILHVKIIALNDFIVSHPYISIDDFINFSGC
jgi:hypothetical protein